MNKPGKLIRKLRNRGMSLKERSRRIRRLVELGAIRDSADIPENAIPVDPDKLTLGYDGMLTKTYFIDRNFSCVECGDLQTWFKEDQMWYFEETGASLEKTAVRCRKCRKGEE